MTEHTGMGDERELASRLLEDSAQYFETLYARHNIGVTMRGIEPSKLRTSAVALRALIRPADPLPGEKSELPARLRAWPFESGDPINAETSFALVKEAADEIERLREANHHYRDAADEARKLRSELKDAREQLVSVKGALVDMIDMYAELVNSGDCGFWDPEKVDEVKRGRAALSKTDDLGC